MTDGVGRRPVAPRTGSAPPSAAPDDAAAQTPREPFRVFAGKLWYWVPIAPLVALDLWSKSAVFAWLTEHYPSYANAEHRVWTGSVSFSLVQWYNTGTVWGLFQNFNNALVVLRCVALLVLVYFVSRTPRRARFQQLVLGLITAGALGNLYDNLTQPEGAVRDFLLFRFWDWPFPAFNVADSCITVGALSLVFLLWRPTADSWQGGLPKSG